MASSKQSPKDAHLLLSHLQDMFLSQIEPEVVQMILVTCDYNVNVAIETLLSLVGQQQQRQDENRSAVTKRERVKKTTANTQSHGDNTNGVQYQTLHTVSETARDSIYKSNEDLYFEEEEGIAARFGIGSRSSTSTKFGTHVLSPDSDRSIEGDASESMTMASNANRQQNAPSNKKHGSGNAHQNAKYSAEKKRFQRVPSKRSENVVPIKGAGDLTSEQTKLVQSLIQSLKQQQKGSKPMPLMANPTPKMKQQGSAAATSKQAQVPDVGHKFNSDIEKAMATKAERSRGNAANPTVLTPQNKEADVIRRIRVGQRVLVLLRGLPGSGKSTLAQKLKHNGVILSADSFFEHNGVYTFDYSLIGEAHTQTRDRALTCMQNNVTPVIIDNTNLESWEMEPYVLLAIKLRYFIALLEPQTPWRYNAYHLVQTNSHGVPYNKLRSMLVKFDHDVTVHTMLRKIGPKIDMHKHKMVLKEQKELNETLGGILNEASRRASLMETKTEVEKQQKKTKVKELQQENVAQQGLKETVTKLKTPEPKAGETETKKQKKKKKNKTLSKSCSVPNIAEMSTDPNVSMKPHYDLVSVDGGMDSDREDFSDEETTTLSENMKDLLLIDFGMEFMPPHKRDPFGDDVGSMDSGLSDPLLPPKKSSRLAASFDYLITNPNWDLPPYPGAGKVKESKDVTIAYNIETTADFVRFDNVVSPSTSVTSSEFDDGKKAEAIVNLKTYFPSVPIEDLRDLIEKCNGNIEWVANLLLDSGYECSMDVNTDKDDGDLEQSAEGMADLCSDDSEENPKTSTTSANFEAGCVFPSSDTLQGVKPKPPQDLVLRIDPVFAMQLEKLFGPVTFHVSSETYYGNDLNVSIDLDTAREIHAFWSQSLMKKFEREESTLNELMMDEGYAKHIQEMEDARMAANLEASDHDPDFPPLTNEALILGSIQKLPSNTEGLASKIKRQQLYEMFPRIDRKAVDEVFKAHDGSFLETVHSIESTFCTKEEPRLVIAPELVAEYENAWLKIAQQESQIMYEKEQEKDALATQKSVVDPSYEDLRAEATVHYHRRQDCFTRAQDAYGKNMTAVASFYSQQGHLHSQKLHEANKRAMEMILSKQNAGMKSNTLDLHMLFVHEAMEALSQFINKKKSELRSSKEPSLTFNIITGKGTHSNRGLPRIKPAVVDFLSRHNYSAYEINAGVIQVKLTKDDIRLTK